VGNDRLKGKWGGDREKGFLIKRTGKGGKLVFRDIEKKNK